MRDALILSGGALLLYWLVTRPAAPALGIPTIAPSWTQQAGGGGNGTYLLPQDSRARASSASGLTPAEQSYDVFYA